MKRKLPVILTGLLIVSLIQAQTDETLTNNAIIKMANAKLSNELIIDVIQSSTVLFDLSASAINNLENENVSSQIIDAMKSAKEVKTDNVAAIPPVAVKKKELVQSIQIIEALNYVAPIKGLVAFYQNEAKVMDRTITDWDNTIRNIIKDINDINNQIIQLESDMRDKKNADSKAYSSEILSQKKKLAEYRAEYKELKNKLIAEGESISKKLTDMSSDNARAISKEFDDVSQQVKSSNTNPETGENAVSITIAGFNFIANTTNYITPSTEMLIWHQNEINELQKLIEQWNPRVKDIIRKDKELDEKLKPVTSKLEEYKSDTKKYKSEIAVLKKQRDAIEKEKKKLADQMENDSKELADYLKKTSTDIQASVKERFTDIIGNINYTYQEKLNL